MITHCPCCGQHINPVYCRVSTHEQPILLAYTVMQASAILGIATASVRAWMEPWGNGWRLTGKRKQRAA